MSLVAETAAHFQKHVFDCLQTIVGWKVLILDEMSTKVLSSCFSMREITAFGITLVESLRNKRMKLGIDAVYIMRPQSSEVDILIKDFTPQARYPAAHVFFLSSCDHDILKRLANSPAMGFIKTLIQLQLDYIPIESQVFLFDAMDTAIANYLPPEMVHDNSARIDQIAEQLVSVCVTLEELPKIYYQMSGMNKELAYAVQTKLNKQRKDNPSLGQGSRKDQSILLLLDRSVDPVSPLICELTLQAMCYDVLPIKDNIYIYGSNCEMELTEKNYLWGRSSHKHIADVARLLAEHLKEMTESKKHFLDLERSVRTSSANPDKNINLSDLSNIVKLMPQYQKEVSDYQALHSMLAQCLQIYDQRLERLCAVEQDLVMGETANGDPVTDPMQMLASIFKTPASTEDYLRIILIFTLVKDGLSEEHLHKLFQCAQIDPKYISLVASLSMMIRAQLVQTSPVTSVTPGRLNMDAPYLKLGFYGCLNALKPVTNYADRLKAFLPSRKKRLQQPDSDVYASSRWTPYVFDLMMQAIENKLDTRCFALLDVQNKNQMRFNPSLTPTTQTRSTKGPSARYYGGSNSGSTLALPNSGKTHTRSPSPSHRGFGDKDKGDFTSINDHCGPRLIVCMVGGLTYSEVRSAYELTQQCVETRLKASDLSSVKTSSSEKTINGGGGVGWNWQVIVAGTHMTTPNRYLDELKTVAQRIAPGGQVLFGTADNNGNIHTGYQNPPTPIFK